MANADGEPIALENMPRQHRGQREKKLMAMDEVDEKFPLMKYKNWVIERAKEGLPTAGGVSLPASNSTHDADSVTAVVAIKERQTTDGSYATNTAVDAAMSTNSDRKSVV